MCKICHLKSNCNPEILSGRLAARLSFKKYCAVTMFKHARLITNTYGRRARAAKPTSSKRSTTISPPLSLKGCIYVFRSSYCVYHLRGLRALAALHCLTQLHRAPPTHTRATYGKAPLGGEPQDASRQCTPCPASWELATWNFSKGPTPATKLRGDHTV